MTVERALLFGIGAIVVAGLTLGAALSSQTRKDDIQRQIQVSGNAMVYGKPDMATVVLGVTETASRVLDAKTRCDQAMQRIQAAVTKAGVRPDDIQTVQYTIFPVQVKAGAARQWKVAHTVSVKVRKVATVASVVDSATGAGANSVSQIQYGIEDLLALKAKARVEAMRIVREKAEQVASLSGTRLGAPLSITDQSEDYGGYQYAANASMGIDISGFNAATRAPLASGQIGVSVQITASYSME